MQRQSLPLRECGLKFQNINILFTVSLSLPLRECGLKSTGDPVGLLEVDVTPFAGVWIEINEIELGNESKASHSLCGSVD